MLDDLIIPDGMVPAIILNEGQPKFKVRNFERGSFLNMF